MLMSKRFQFTRLCSRCYSGCQKNVPVFKRFFLQPLIPQFRNSEHYYESGIKIFKETICRLLFTIQALTLIHKRIFYGFDLLLGLGCVLGCGRLKGFLVRAAGDVRGLRLFLSPWSRLRMAAFVTGRVGVHIIEFLNVGVGVF
jgi:hypothetical protein